METIETYLVEEEAYIYLTKVDLKKRDDEVTGFKVTCFDRVVECDLKQEKPSLLVRKLSEEDRLTILKKGFSNVGKTWSFEELKDLERRYTEDKEDIEYIATIFERTGRAIFLQLKKMGLIPESEKFNEQKYQDTARLLDEARRGKK